LSKDGKRRDSEVFLADQDSTESTFLKTLSELASLVVASLAPIEKNDNDNNEAADDQHPQDQNESKGGEIALTIDDSILSEATRVGVDAAGDNIGGGAIEGSDLGSTGTYLVCTHKIYQHDLFCCLHHCFPLLDLKKNSCLNHVQCTSFTITTCCTCALSSSNTTSGGLGDSAGCELPSFGTLVVIRVH